MNETIYYKSPVGILQIKNTGDAISSLLFLNTQRSKPTDESKLDFSPPKTRIIKKCIKQLDGYFTGKHTDFDLNLAQEGTAFQQAVWTQLQKIKYGNTCSYLTLSKNLGNAKAIRAVGTANGKNDIVIIVPCHRVIGSDGSLVGYGGDLWRKQWLLEHEAKYAHGVQTLF